MNIGFRLFARQSWKGWVWGEEVMVEGLAKRISRITGQAVWVGDRKALADDVDVMVSLASDFDGVPSTQGARNILWQQFPGALREDRMLPFERLASSYDFVFCGSIKLKELVNAPNKSEVLYVTADDEVAHASQSSSEHRIVFIGNHHSNLRSEARLKAFLEPVEDLGLTVYGSGWEKAPERLRQRWCGPIDFGRVPDIYRAAAIVISIHGDKHVALQMPNSRVMEAAACSACVVSDKFPELENLFDDTVAWTDGGEALRRTVIDLLHDPLRRKQLGIAARKRLLEQCSLEMTARRIIKRAAELLQGGDI
jgi:hypothetical protein